MRSIRVDDLELPSIESLNISQVYPPQVGRVNLNTCADPDCPNYGVALSPTLLDRRGGSKALKKAMVSDDAVAAGLGRYKMESSSRKADKRTSYIFEYWNNPVGWSDNRSFVCQHIRGNTDCKVSQKILSNQHFDDEVSRLRSMNGLLDGPSCGACGQQYLEAPEQFAFDGANGKSIAGNKRHRKSGKPIGVRLVHKPCRGKKGARFTVSAEHSRQKDRADNIRIFTELVNNASLTSIQRKLSLKENRNGLGMARLYDRIFWLERVLLAYERAQLSKWRKRTNRNGGFRHSRIAHDDIVLTVNWETRKDRRTTQLNCSISADIESGYVFRIDVDFDPTIEPVNYLLDTYYREPRWTMFHKRYTKADGTSFTAPLLDFQRPSGRYHEGPLFASAESHLRLFRLKTHEGFAHSGMPIDQATEDLLKEARNRELILGLIRKAYFNFPEAERDTRNAFSGIMTSDTYTKAAHLECLREMLPNGKLTLVSEQEAAMARVVPHVFREDIEDDLFEWLVVHFDKAATKGETTARTNAFSTAFRRFRQANPNLTPWDALHAWTNPRLRPAVRARGKSVGKFPIDNFQARSFPELWLHSPVQVAKETNKTVGFPILSPRYREEFKKLGFQTNITDAKLREAITRRVVSATLQPVASFMVSLRDRNTLAVRAGSGGARKGPSYVNGASYNPRVLIALLNIYRIHYNYFEKRDYVSPLNKHEETDAVPAGIASIQVPGEDIRIEVAKRRHRAPIKRTPAARASIIPRRPDGSDAKTPDPAKTLYQPWLAYGTPLWGKLK
ncbi:MAG: hypothetical protein CMM86_12410 [Rhodovulum sp.]|nr:hypothetical protein [Rhodovulum sp.]